MANVCEMFKYVACKQSVTALSMEFIEIEKLCKEFYVDSIWPRIVWNSGCWQINLVELKLKTDAHG